MMEMTAESNEEDGRDKRNINLLCSLRRGWGVLGRVVHGPD